MTISYTINGADRPEMPFLACSYGNINHATLSILEKESINYLSQWRVKL